jgi:hypothetical protein
MYTFCMFLPLKIFLLHETFDRILPYAFGTIVLSKFLLEVHRYQCPLQSWIVLDSRPFS